MRFAYHDLTQWSCILSDRSYRDRSYRDRSVIVHAQWSFSADSVIVHTVLRGTGNVVDAYYILYLFKALYYSDIF